MRGRMHEVELVEADEPGRSRPARDAPADVRLDDEHPVDPQVAAARSWLRRRARLLVPAVAVLVGTLVGAQVLLDQRESRRLAELAAVPGVVRPVDSSIGVLWRADAQLAPALRSGAMVDGVLVGGIQDATGAPVLVGLDPDTGRIEWRTPVEAEPVPAGAELWITCNALTHGTSQVAGCVAQVFGANVEGTPRTAVWVLDPAEGELLMDRLVDGRSGMTFTDDAIVTTEHVADDGEPARWRVTAQDLVTGETRWTWTTPPSAVADRESDPDVVDAATYSSLQTQDGHLVLGVDQHAWVLTTEGDLHLDVPLEPAAWLQPVRAGVFLESTWTSADLYRGSLLLPDGSRVPVDEVGGWLAVDDGSAPDVVLTVGEAPRGADRLSGRSAATGELLWRLPGSIVTSLLLDGTVYVATVDALVAVDAVTGDVRWRTELENLAQQLSTDGRYLLVPGLGATLQAYTLGDGRLAWSADLSQEIAGDGSATSVQGFQSGPHDPRLYVWTGDGGVAVLG
ncbi:PQQ-binding-like beta-propeller repeat protein [uncultured Cellulomonas sp.]|uniref:outer membrane protein assembly factor BamB family protein n=1 Tax=uncultured Cellulomonas sp. TaxID=189682 RepID=UPI0028EA816E|nr:PQQ-binding-like beta-propeller repeat protein [uncultured Cellulomonas sp.]